jgi:F0F1-type ATP synthase assembly protein I
MTTPFFKHIVSLTISILFLLALFLTARLYPSIGIPLGMIVLLFGLVTSIYMIIKKNREVCLQGKISSAVAIRNSFLEIIGILLAMVLAGWVGRMLAELVTAQIGHETIRLVAGLVTGLLAGAVTGALLKGLSSRMLKV